MFPKGTAVAKLRKAGKATSGQPTGFTSTSRALDGQMKSIRKHLADFIITQSK